MNKTVYTLNIDNYMPDVCALTYPLMRAYAKKINARFKIIDKRIDKLVPVTMEKLQVGYYGYTDDWSIFVDSDALIHPDMPDLTTKLRPDTIAQYGFDLASLRFEMNRDFERDGRNLSSCGWFTIASRLTVMELFSWRFDWEELLAGIKLLDHEKDHTTPEHLIDECILSNNIARYGLKTTSIVNTQWKDYLHHTYNLPYESKLLLIRDKLKEWNLNEQNLRTS